MTSRPACASGSAATPPAAPRPMMTTSVSFNLVLTGPRFRERLVVVRRFVVRLQIVLFELLLIRTGHHRPDARVADEIPADEVRVAAVVGIAERALMRVVQHEGEERGGVAGEAGGRAGFDVD